MSRQIFDKKGLLIYRRLSPDKRIFMEKKKEREFYMGLSKKIDQKIGK